MTNILARPTPARLAPAASTLIWTLIWIAAIGLALAVHLAFMNRWPDSFIHEDSAAYIDEARSILTGHYIDDPGRRPYGVAFFLALVAKLFSPNILVFAAAQHALSIAGALMVAAAVRFAGASRVFALLTFLLGSLYARTVHYDNFIGAEAISVFLMSLSAFIASGAVFRKWPLVPCAIGIGASLGFMMVCRSASVGFAAAILFWMAVSLETTWFRRLAVPAFTCGLAALVYLTPAGVNWAIGKHPAGSESSSAMQFIVGYSGDFDGGVHLDRKAQARAFVNKMRADYDPMMGWANGGQANWPLEAAQMMRRPGDTEQDLGNLVRDICVETLTTPSTLWYHVSRHFLPEMMLLLLDVSIPARHVSSPAGYDFWVHNDPYPLFHSPTGLKPGELVSNYYSVPENLAWLLPSVQTLQSTFDDLLQYGYLPRLDPAPICCGLTISSEYDFDRGPIRWLSISMLILLCILLFAPLVERLTRVQPLPRNLVAGGGLMVLLALINAAFPAFIVYGLNRYAYYVTPYMAGATGILGAVALDRIELFRRRRRAAASPAASTASAQA